MGASWVPHGNWSYKLSTLLELTEKIVEFFSEFDTQDFSIQYPKLTLEQGDLLGAQPWNGFLYCNVDGKDPKKFQIR